MTEVAVSDDLTHYEATQLTERIKIKAGMVRDSMHGLQALVDRAKAGNAHEVLGFASWTAYLSETLGGKRLTLPRDERQELVSYLAGEGMSTRAIAPIVGVDQKTVSNDIRSTEEFSSVRPATVTSLDGRERPATQPARVEYVDTVTGEILDPVAVKAEPLKPQQHRRPLADGFRDASLDLDRLVTRIENLISDDRFPKNKNEVARYANDLIRARDALQGVINQMS